MENPCRIVTFGDSITRAYTPILERRLHDDYSEYDIEVVNEGVVGDTSVSGLARIETVLAHDPDVVAVGFGMNDWRKGVDRPRFRSAMGEIVDRLLEAGIRVLLLTINPDWQGPDKGTSAVIGDYNDDIKAVAGKKKIRIVDVEAAWRRAFPSLGTALDDTIHPSTRGHRVSVDAIMKILPRVSTTVVWQYNGHYGLCNYRCPYCYYPTKKHFFQHSIDKWREGFLELFGRQRVTFYLSYGEPMLGKNFYEVLEMIASEPQWDCIITTNLSVPLDRLCRTELVQEGRFEVNASFHPTQKAGLGEFLSQLLVLREHDIEAPVVYVMYPQQIKDFETHFRVLDRHGFFVHVRRFRGRYRNVRYPEAYTEEERRLTAAYMDGTSVRMMLSNPNSIDRPSYAGMFYIVVDNVGNVARSPDFQVYGDYGNIVAKTARLDNEPMPFTGVVHEGSVDGTAMLLDSGLKELVGNHIWSYATQGGVRKENGTIHYPFRHVNFADPRVRWKYRFGSLPSRILYTGMWPLTVFGSR